MPGGWPDTKDEGEVLTTAEWNAVVNALATMPGHLNANGKNLVNVGSISLLSEAVLVDTATGLEGDVTGTIGATVLAESGVTPGAYPKVTVDIKGRVTAGEALAAEDIPDLSAAYAPVVRTITAGAGLTGGGDLSGDRTLAVVADSTTQRIEVLKGGTPIGTRKSLNLIEGSSVTLTAADDAPNNRVNVTVAAADGSKWTQASGYLHPATPNRVVVGTSADDGVSVLLSACEGTTSRVFTVRYAGSFAPHFRLAHSAGTLASPTFTPAGAALGTVAWDGYSPSGYVGIPCATIRAYASADFSDSSKGSYILFEATAIGATTTGPRLEMGEAGNITLNLPAAATDSRLWNSSLAFYLQSNTSLRVRVRGADGTVREGTITLS